MRSCTHFRIKLYHAIVTINGLRYVQLKWCLLKRKWECLPLLGSQNTKISPARSCFSSLWCHGSTPLQCLRTFEDKAFFFSCICWEQKNPKESKNLLSQYKNQCISNGNTSTNLKLRHCLKRTLDFQNTSKSLFPTHNSFARIVLK